MNLILFQRDEIDRPLPAGDPRAVHILKTLRRTEGEPFDVGVIGGMRGKAVITSRSDGELRLEFTLNVTPPPLDDITLLLGLARPQSVRKILQEATALGVRALHFVQTEKSEASYAQSTLWSSGEWQRHLITGAEQAFDTQIPGVHWGEDIESVIRILSPNATRIALDNYESPAPLGSSFFREKPTPCIIAIGPERGWGAKDRDLLRQHGFSFAHLGARVLRMETAVVSALAITKSARNVWE